MQKYAKRATYGDGEKLKLAEKTIRESWQEFQSVSHLWAAMRFNQSYPYAAPTTVFSAKGFPAFLEVAQGLCKFGCAFIRPSVPILDVRQAWNLPKSIATRTLRSDRIPDMLLKYLKTYKA